MTRLLAAAIAGPLVLLLLAGFIIAKLWSGATPNPDAIEIGGPFTLTAPDGHNVTDADFRGKWMLVYFGYTNCPDACPMALNSVAGALDLMKTNRNDIAPIFITVDPARDTPKVMGHYVGLFDSQIIGLSGTATQIAQVEREYRVYAARHATPDGSYSMDHSSILYVMDPHGHFNSILDGAAAPRAIASKLETLEGRPGASRGGVLRTTPLDPVKG